MGEKVKMNSKKRNILMLAIAIVSILLIVLLVQILRVNNSSRSYEDAIKYEQDSNYELAIEYYDKVIKSDKNYEIAQNKILEINDKLLEMDNDAIQLNSKILSLKDDKAYNQDELENIKNEYENFSNRQKELVENYDEFEKIFNNLTDYEHWGYKTCLSIIEHLKNPDSFNINSITLKRNESAAASTERCIVKVNYSAQNGFGGTNRETLYLSFMVENDDVSFMMTFDEDGDVNMYMFLKYLQSSAEEIELDPDRIMSFINK